MERDAEGKASQTKEINGLLGLYQAASILLVAGSCVVSHSRTSNVLLH